MTCTPSLTAVAPFCAMFGAPPSTVPGHPLVSPRAPTFAVIGVSELVDGADAVVAALLVELESDQTLFGGMLEQVGEVAVAVVALVEAGVHAFDGLLHERAPHGRVVLLERRYRGQQPIEPFLLLAVLRLLRFRALPLRYADQIVVEDELVAVV